MVDILFEIWFLAASKKYCTQMYISQKKKVGTKGKINTFPLASDVYVEGFMREFL